MGNIKNMNMKLEKKTQSFQLLIMSCTLVKLITINAASLFTLIKWLSTLAQRDSVRIPVCKAKDKIKKLKHISTV